MEATWIWLIPLLPFAGALANGILHGRTLARRTAAAAGFPVEGDKVDLLAPEPDAVPTYERTSGRLG